MAKPEKRWQLLLVADDGRIVPFKRIKGIAVALVILTVILGLLCAGLAWQLTAEKLRHRQTRGQLADANRQAAHYKSEHELVAAELVLAEARMEKAGLSVPGRQEQASRGEIAPTGTDAASSTVNKKRDPPSARSMAAAQSTGAPTPSSEPTPVVETAEPPKSPAKKTGVKPSPGVETSPVELGDLELEHTPDKKLLQARFRVKNTGPRSSPVAGRCVVVLKSNRLQPQAWLTLPKVTLVDGKPDGQRGQEFKIANYIDVEIKFRGRIDPAPFKTATVYVFDPSARLILEKDFAIDLPAPPPEPASAAESPEPAETPAAGAPDPEPSAPEDTEPPNAEDSRAPF